MRHLGQDEVIQLMGVGTLGEVRQGPDGNLYQWVETVDGLGNPIGGFWRRLRRAAQRALPVAQQVASAIPHPAAQAVAAGLRTATPILQRAGVAGANGLGALYQAPDGTLYLEAPELAEDEEPEGLEQDEELDGFAEEEELEGLEQGYVREDGTSGLEQAYVPDQPTGTPWFTPAAQPAEKRTVMWEPLW
jgi:hypothetical protein